MGGVAAMPNDDVLSELERRGIGSAFRPRSNAHLKP